MIGYTQAEIKVFTGSDWVWITVPISTKRQRHEVETNQQLSPDLMVRNGSVSLAVPFKSKPKQLHLNGKLVSVDVGINTTATATVVCSDGTVTSRRFIHRGADIDRRDKRLKTISHKARLTMGKSGKLSKGFCKKIYRKCRNINREIAQKVSRELVNMAVQNGCAVIVFENLTSWKPQRGRKRSHLKQRFHGWLHRLLVKLTTEKFEELGGIVELVYLVVLHQ
jgi:putative transposase